MNVRRGWRLPACPKKTLTDDPTSKPNPRRAIRAFKDLKTMATGISANLIIKD